MIIGGRTSRPLLLLLLLLLVASLHDLALGAPTTTNTTSGPPAAPSNASCDSQLLFQKLYVLMPAINQCANESNYTINPDGLAFPSETTLDKFCRSENCTQLSRELDNAGLPSCTVPVGNTSMSFKAFFKAIRVNCSGGSAASDGPHAGPPRNGAAPTVLPGSMTLALVASLALLHSALVIGDS